MWARRSFLGWLCCALLVCNGLVSASRVADAWGVAAPCGSTGPSEASCCVPKACHCHHEGGSGTEASEPAACCCGEPRAPEPGPQTPAPPVYEALPPEAPPRHGESPQVATPKILVALSSGLGIGALPRRSRQEALSIWRC
ncbi:MAG: hypothetical protein R3F56_26080 [Planctomycetota bacterium]